jgi:hypothetical protein
VGEAPAHTSLPDGDRSRLWASRVPGCCRRIFPGRCWRGPRTSVPDPPKGRSRCGPLTRGRQPKRTGRALRPSRPPGERIFSRLGSPHILQRAYFFRAAEDGVRARMDERPPVTRSSSSAVSGRPLRLSPRCNRAAQTKTRRPSLLEQRPRALAWGDSPLRGASSTLRRRATSTDPGTAA